MPKKKHEPTIYDEPAIAAALDECERSGVWGLLELIQTQYELEEKIQYLETELKDLKRERLYYAEKAIPDTAIVDGIEYLKNIELLSFYFDYDPIPAEWKLKYDTKVSISQRNESEAAKVLWEQMDCKKGEWKMRFSIHSSTLKSVVSKWLTANPEETELRAEVCRLFGVYEKTESVIKTR